MVLVRAQQEGRLAAAPLSGRKSESETRDLEASQKDDDEDDKTDACVAGRLTARAQIRPPACPARADTPAHRRPWADQIPHHIEHHETAEREIA